jgi:ABC-type nickel/cobalt efflux system permease component RcnA
MRRRLYFLLPNLDLARKVHDELLLAKVEERHIHVLAKEGMELDDLPEANLLQKTDIIHGLQLGMIIGGLTGAILSIIAVSLDFMVPGWEVWSVLSISAGGALVGAFASSMIAVNVRNTRLEQFSSDMDHGKILYMVDVPVHRVDEINGMIHNLHPEADMRGVEPTIPAFP